MAAYLSQYGRIGVTEIEHAGRPLYRLVHLGTELEFPVEFDNPVAATLCSAEISDLADWDGYVDDIKRGNNYAGEHDLWLAILNIANERGGNRIGSTHNSCLDWQKIRMRERMKGEGDAPLSE